MKSKFNLQNRDRDSSTGLSVYNEKNYLVPKVDILEDRNKVYYVYELPGIAPESLTVELSASSIFISAQTYKQEKKLVRQERTKGTFFRQLPLPEKTDSNTAQADFEHGLLEISFNKLNSC